MTWFDEIQVPEGADEATEWAASAEYDMRYRRSEREREGLVKVFAKAASSMGRLNAVLAGDPDVPSFEREERELVDAEEYGRLAG
jgi:hypothetical protein